MPLSGELHAHTAELGLISLYVPDIDRAAGELDADLQRRPARSAHRA